MHSAGRRQYPPDRKAEICCLEHTNMGDHSTWGLILKPHFTGKPSTTTAQLALEKNLSRLAHKAAEFIQTNEKAKL